MTRRTREQFRVDQLVRKLSAPIRTAFVEAMEKASFDVDRAALIRFLETGQVERAIELLRIDRGIIGPLIEAQRQALIAGGMAIAPELPKSVSGKFGFFGQHPRAVAIAEEQAARMITMVDSEAAASARRIITDGLNENRSLNKVARDLVGKTVGQKRVGGVIGLTEQQTQRMIYLRSMLSDPERISDYFKDAGMTKPRYKEANRRFDQMIRRAIKDQRALSGADIDKLTEAYKRKAMGERGKRIARDEAFSALSQGRDEAYMQVSERDDIEAVTVRWQKSPRVDDREDHLEMDGTTIAVGEDFIMPDGTRMRHPHDPNGGPTHNAGCGCVGIYRTQLKRR